MAVQIILKNSSVEDKRPKTLANGEISLNYHADGAFLCCQDTEGNIQQVGGVKIATDAPDEPVKQTQWFNPDNLTLYIFDGDAWQPIGGGSGGGIGSGITDIIGNNGIDADNVGDVVTLDVDINTSKGLHFELSKLAINPGANISFDADGKLQADIDTLSYKGTVDLTSDPVPSAGSAGDAFVNIGSGAMSAAWQTATALGATTVSPGDLVVKSPAAWSYIPTGGVEVQTNLGIDSRGVETLDITSSTGDDVTIPAATDALAGLMTAADKATLDAGGTPNGGTGDRPDSPDIGDLYFDTDLELLLVWNGTSWEPVSPPQAPGQWTRTGTKLAPTNPGDTVVVTAADGTENITLNADGSISATTSLTTGSNISLKNGFLDLKRNASTSNPILTLGNDSTLYGQISIAGVANFTGVKVGAAGVWDKFLVSDNGSVYVGGTITTDPNILLNAANGSITAAGTGDFAGDVTINTDKITLDATDGDITLAGDLNIAGDIINTTVDGDQDIICDG